MRLLEIAGAVVAGAGALALLWRAERRARRLANRLLGSGPEQPGALDRLDDVWAQVHPNSGSSLRDAVDRVERDLAEHIASPHPRR